MTGLPRGSSGRDALEVARECAATARTMIMAAFGSVAVSGVKGRGNVVTETDTAVELQVTDLVRREFPDHALLGEETAPATRSEGWMWVVDPIDGTKNFSRGIPHFGFGLALCLASQPILAVALQPVTGDEFVAVKGQGCAVNGLPARVSGATSVVEAVASFDMGYDDDRARRQLETIVHLWPGMQSLRVMGSAVLGPAYVAAGRWDLYVHLNLKPWDIATGLLLVREAGGVVSERDGRPASLYSETLIAATPGVHADFLRLAPET